MEEVNNTTTTITAFGLRPLSHGDRLTISAETALPELQGLSAQDAFERVAEHIAAPCIRHTVHSPSSAEIGGFYVRHYGGDEEMKRTFWLAFSEGDVLSAEALQDMSRRLSGFSGSDPWSRSIRDLGERAAGALSGTFLLRANPLDIISLAPSDRVVRVVSGKLLYPTAE